MMIPGMTCLSQWRQTRLFAHDASGNESWFWVINASPPVKTGSGVNRSILTKSELSESSVGYTVFAAISEGICDNLVY